MRTDLENYLLACLNDGWCETSGDVESPVGFFGLVSSHETWLELAEYANDEIEGIKLGHLYGVQLDSDGFMRVTDFGFECYGSARSNTSNDVQISANAWFNGLEDAYTEWLDA